MWWMDDVKWAVRGGLYFLKMLCAESFRIWSLFCDDQDILTVCTEYVYDSLPDPFKGVWCE